MKRLNVSTTIVSIMMMLVSTLSNTVSAGETIYGSDGFIVDGLAYVKNADGKTVRVTALYEYDDNLGTLIYPDLHEANIPETVSYDGVTYTVTEIDASAFSAFGYNQNLTKVTIPNTVTKIGESAFCYCVALDTVSIGNGVIEICDNAFNGCNKLKSIVLPDKLSYIGHDVFMDCYGLTSVTLGKSVKYIGGGAFNFCSSLKDFYCHLMNPLATMYESEDADPGILFFQVPLANCTLHVPFGTKEEYENCSQWNGFGTIVEDLEPHEDVEAWITLPVKHIILQVGQELQLIEPLVNPSDMELTWTSSDEGVAVVSDDRVVKAIAPGGATITVTGNAPNNPTATCLVTVKESDRPASDVNGDGKIDIADVNVVVNAMLGKE